MLARGQFCLRNGVSTSLPLRTSAVVQYNCPDERVSCCSGMNGATTAQVERRSAAEYSNIAAQWTDHRRVAGRVSGDVRVRASGTARVRARRRLAEASDVTRRSNLALVRGASRPRRARSARRRILSTISRSCVGQSSTHPTPPAPPPAPPPPPPPPPPPFVPRMTIDPVRARSAMIPTRCRGRGFRSARRRSEGRDSRL